MKLRKFTFYLAILCAVFLIAACGNPASPGTTTQVAVTGVSLDKTTLSLAVGGSATLTATVAPSNATTSTVKWTSSDATIATVTNGTVKAVAIGSATITVTTDDGGKTAVCKVSVTAPVAATGVSLNKSKTVLLVGKKETLYALLSPATATNQNVTWSSDNASSASVDAGVVTGVAAGSANITVTTDDGGYKATCAVTVSATAVAVTGISLDKTAMNLAVGGSKNLAATFVPDSATNQNLAWSSDKADVATVSSSGLVTGVAAGSANITVTTDDGGYKASCAVTVSADTANAVADPSFSLTGGDYWGMQILTLSCATDGATIYYTTDGSSPTSASTQYSSEIVLRSSQTVKAIAVKSGMADSDLISNKFAIIYYDCSSDSLHRPAYFTNGVATLLQTPSGMPYGYAAGMKLSGGQIVCDGYVYAQDNSTTYQPCYWAGTTYHGCELPTSQDANVSVTGGYVYGNFAIDENGRIYIPGSVALRTTTTDASGNKTYTNSSIPCYWVDGEYKALSGSSGYARLMTLVNGNLFILGQSEGKPCYWQGVSLNMLDMPSSRTGGLARNRGYIGTTPYIVGWTYETVTDSTTQNTTTIQHPCYWIDGSYTELSIDTSATSTSKGGRLVNLFKSTNGDLYAAGYLIGADYEETPCYWKNGTCTVLPMPADPGVNVYGSVSNFKEVNGHIYMTGWYENDNTSTTVDCYWLDGKYYPSFSGGNVAVSIE